MIETFEPAVIRDFAIALLIGALVGIEREKHQALDGDTGPGGLRTFILIAMTGAVSAWISERLGTPWIFVATLLAVAGAVVAGYVLSARARPAALGLTTEMAAVAVFLLGGAVILGHPAIAVALAIVTSATLAFKRPLHGIVDRLGTEDIYAGLKLLIATFIVLPLLPDTAVDPWGALNPHRLWLLVILISTLSLVGYVAVRGFGPAKGMVVTGLAGGLVSSTAMTLAFARRSREGGSAPGGIPALAGGILLAWSAMFVRVIVEVAVVNRALLQSVLVPFAIMAGIAAGFAVFDLARGGRVAPTSGSAVRLVNPFSLTAAGKFAAFFALVLLVVKLAELHLPGGGVYAIAGLAGLTDVDAITLSMAEQARRTADYGPPVRAIQIASITNTVAKCAFVFFLGSPRLRRRVGAATATILAGGIVSLVALVPR